MITGKDNNLLVEFEFLMDLDLAMYKYIKANFYDSPLVDKKLMSLKDEHDIIKALLYREHLNPLEIIIPGQDTTQMYYELMGDKYIDLLRYVSIYDTFALMITFLKEASSVAIDVLCKSKVEAAIIKALNSKLNTVIYKNKYEAPVQLYTAIYVKYFVNLNLYNDIQGKHIYIPAARYNMQDGQDSPDVNLVKIYSVNNEIHLIDMYKEVKFRFNRKDNNNADLF